MDRRIYEAQLQLVFTIVRQIQMLDLAGMLNQIEHTHAAGPVLDPTLYRDGLKNLTLTEDLIRAAHEFQGRIVEIKSRHLPEEATK